MAKLGDRLPEWAKWIITLSVLAGFVYVMIHSIETNINERIYFKAHCLKE